MHEDKPAPPAPIHPTGLIRYTETPEIALDPAVLGRNLVVTADGNDPVTSAYKVLRTRVLQRMTAGGWNVLAITSPGPGEGKTLTALNLAISLSKEVNHTVLLVEIDLRRPTLHQYLGHRHKLGLTDYLLRDVSLKSVMFNPGINRLVIIQAGSTVPNSSELLSLPRMVDLVREIKERYPSRLVLFDLPPLLLADDGLVFLPYVDAALLVVSQDRTTHEEVIRAKDFLSSTHVIGVVLNHSTRQIKGY
ncbi:MAG: exopolysaccharide biosynthesis protein [Candidatus Competibacteraceae bacterium]